MASNGEVLNEFGIDLQLFRDGALIGTTLLPNLTLEMGNNSLIANGSFEVCLHSLKKKVMNLMKVSRRTIARKACKH